MAGPDMKSSRSLSRGFLAHVIHGELYMPMSEYIGAQGMHSAS